MLLAVKFRIGGSLRFLSHAETLSLFQRACVRADISVQYSQGFNPRPKLSLPLPRPVGVASDDELLCLRLARQTQGGLTRDLNGQGAVNHESCQTSWRLARIQLELSAQLPEGCEVLSVRVVKENASIQPRSATYVLVVCKEYLNPTRHPAGWEELKSTIKHLLASESLSLQRRTAIGKSRIDNRRYQIKNVDVRGFLKSINLDRNSIIVECKISPVGSIRVDEILELLELDARKLAAPIRRTNVQWQEA